MTERRQTIASRQQLGRIFVLSYTLLAIAYGLAFPFTAFADAVLYVSPERGNYKVGQTFEIKVYADSGGSLINAAEGDISFDTEAFQVESVSKQDSILQNWSTEPAFSNEEGTLHFAGWTRNNFKGVNGLLVTITFKALRSMTGNARLAAGAILAADGQETNIITSMRSGVFTIEREEIPEQSSEFSEGEESSASSTENEIKAKVPAPTFDDFPDRVTIGDRIVVRGSAEPNSRVYFWISRGSEQETQTQVLTALDGSFTFVSEDKAVPGVYHLRAMVETEDGRQSPQSETIDITASETGLAASAVFGASLVFELLPFIALLVLGGLGAGYIYHRHQLAKMHYGRHSMFDMHE